MFDEERLRQLVAEFREKSEPLGVAVIRAETEGEAARALVEWLSSLGTAEVLAASELTARASWITANLEAAGITVHPSGSPETTRDSPAGLSLAHMAIAETGSMLLCEPSLEDRSIGMLCLAQAIVCPTSALSPSLDDVAPALRRMALGPGGAFSTLVTGPSRTADIERVLTVGVQGPGKVLAVFVDEL